jgi:prepilin-type N-terminal cleavage/methylation domain-containing protein
VSSAALKSSAAAPVLAQAGRGGFTLLEVMIAVVLTSVVALMAYASAQVSVEAGVVIQDGLRTVGTERAARQALVDLLHNVRPAQGRADTGLVLAGDTLAFTAAGALPLDPDYDWRVTIRPGDDGLVIAARSLGRGPAAQVALRLPRVTRWQVRVLPPRGTEWRDQWMPGPVLPEALAITLWNQDSPFGPPLTVRLSDAASPAPESEYLGE